MAPKDSLRAMRLRPLRIRPPAIVALALIAAGSATAGALVASDGSEERPGRLPEASRVRPVERVSFLAKLIPPAPEPRSATGPRVPRSISDLVRRLPLERKVAQLFLVGFKGQRLTAPVFERLRRLDLGGIVIDQGNYTGAQVLGLLAGEALVISQQEGHIPPWVMAAQEGGEFNAFPDLPPATAPADLASADEAGAEAAEAGATLRALGVSGLLAPVIDVGLVDEPALGARVYSDDPAEVAGFADAVVSSYTRARIFSAVKHFPGLGTASQPTEEGPATVGLSLTDLRRRDLIPFRAAFEAGVPGVVLSHALYQVDDFTVPGSLSRRIVTDLLRRRLRFRGVAITDDLADPAITAQAAPADAAVRALRAGADMLYISGPAGDQQAAYVAVLRAVRQRRLSRGRLDAALLRILDAKRRFGLIR
jgi:beta-N-acetylhexosaminidase